jgi:magnesium-transporting ATPase (P-type)
MLAEAVAADQLPVRDPSAGLTESEAATLRANGQGNTAQLRTGRTYGRSVRDNVLTFVNIVLFSLGTALVLLGHWSDALVSVGVVTVNLLVGVVQEVRARRMLDRIALLTLPTRVSSATASNERSTLPIWYAVTCCDCAPATRSW